jgi:hypothetical protein
VDNSEHGWRAWRARRRGEWWAERARNVAALEDVRNERAVKLIEMKADAKKDPELDRWGFPTCAAARTSKEFEIAYQRLCTRQRIAELEIEAGIETPYDQDPFFSAADLGTFPPRPS